MAGDYRNGGKRSNGAVVDYIANLTPATILNLRASISYWVEDLTPFGNQGFDNTQLGFPKSLVDQLPKRDLFPQISIANARTLGHSSGNVTFEPTTVLSLQPNLVHVRGKHTLKTGLDSRVTRYTQLRPGSAAGTYDFNRNFTRRDYLVQDATSGVGAASLLLGYATSGSVANVAQPYFQWIYYAPWIQDDIKVTRKLTLNLGFRWDLNTPLSERFNRTNYGLNQGNPAIGGNPNFLNQQVPNPFAGLIPGTGLDNVTVARSQLLRPFPQFTGFNVEQLNTGRIWYNSLQVTATKRYAKGLSFTTTYTLSKNIEALTI